MPRRAAATRTTRPRRDAAAVMNAEAVSLEQAAQPNRLRTADSHVAVALRPHQRSLRPNDAAASAQIIATHTSDQTR
jgi:hypothetical protein